MKRSHLLSFGFILFLFGSISAQSAKVADTAEQNLRKHIEYLASEKLEGRRTGEQGATSAAGYVANQFAKFRLRPGHRSHGSKPSFLQPFPYVAGVALGTDNFLRIVPSDTGSENKMEIGINWMPLGYSPNADIVPTELVFAGYGIESAELKYDDYGGLDVKNKIVLIHDGTPESANPHSSFSRFDTHRKAKIAKDKGALALVIIASDTDFKNDRLARLVYDRTFGETAIPVVGIMREHGAELLGAKDVKELAEIERWLAMKTNAPPAPQTETQPSTNFRDLKAIAQLKVNLTKKQVEAYNVIGILEGTDPVLKNEAIAIGAHYDHLGKGGQGSLAVNSSEIHFGADDNASGTAAVLELARQFASEPRATGFRNKRTLIFMAFGGEEEGLLGSKYYVGHPAWPLDKTVAMINLDMVGRLNENKLTIGGIGTASEWKILALETAVNQPMRLAMAKAGKPEKNVGNLQENSSTTIATKEATFSTIPRIPQTDRSFELQLNEDGFGPSDHSSFYGKQIPVLFFFTGTHNDYHKPSDTSERINYGGLLKITDYVAEIVKSVDQNPTKPTYTLAKSSGVMGGRTGFNVSLGTVPNYADTTDGLLLDGVRENSPAAKAGLKAGDKIVRLAGKEVRNAMDYTYVLGTMKAGEEYEVELLRGTEKLALKIIPAPAARRP